MYEVNVGMRMASQVTVALNETMRVGDWRGRVEWYGPVVRFDEATLTYCRDLSRNDDFLVEGMTMWIGGADWPVTAVTDQPALPSGPPRINWNGEYGCDEEQLSQLFEARIRIGHRRALIAPFAVGERTLTLYATGRSYDYDADASGVRAVVVDEWGTEVVTVYAATSVPVARILQVTRERAAASLTGEPVSDEWVTS